MSTNERVLGVIPAARAKRGLVPGRVYGLVFTTARLVILDGAWHGVMRRADPFPAEVSAAASLEPGEIAGLRIDRWLRDDPDGTACDEACLRITLDVGAERTVLQTDDEEPTLETARAMAAVLLSRRGAPAPA